MLARPSLLQSQVVLLRWWNTFKQLNQWLLQTSRSKTKFFNCNLPFFSLFFFFLSFLHVYWKPSDPILRVIFSHPREKKIPASHWFLRVPTRCRTQTLPGIWGTRRVADKLHQLPFKKMTSLLCFCTLRQSVWGLWLQWLLSAVCRHLHIDQSSANN